MSRIAYIISAYKDATHLARLIKALDQEADFYIHVDQNSDIAPFEAAVKGITSDEKSRKVVISSEADVSSKAVISSEADVRGKIVFVPRHRISWGGWEQVEYQKELLGAVLQSGQNYGHVVCLSGQDYPLWSNKRIHRYFNEHADTEFIMGMNLTHAQNRAQVQKITCYHFFRDLPWKNLWLKNKCIVLSRNLLKCLPLRKPRTTLLDGKTAEVYFGSDYWALTLPCARYVYEKLCTEKALVRYFQSSFVPSELCIQTLVFNSPFAKHALHYSGDYQGLSALTPLHYIVYRGAIQIMKANDLPALQQSGKMFCRKVVSGTSDALVQLLEEIRVSEEKKL